MKDSNMLGGVSMSKLSMKNLVVIALILSLVTSALVYSYLKRVSLSATKTGYPVIVAKTDIPPKTKITPDMLQEMNVPLEYTQPGALKEMQAVVGVVSREKIIAGEQITEQRLFLDKRSTGFVGLIPANKRAITVAVTEVTGVAGFVKPGDYVDVVAIFDKQQTGEDAGNFVLQNILILATNKETENSAEGQTASDKKDMTKTATVTLAVAPAEEHWIALADEKGKIRLALRPLLPEVATVDTETATPVKLVGLHNVLGNSSMGRGAILSAPLTSSPAPASAQTAPQEWPQTPVYQQGITVIRGTKVDIVPTH